MNRLKGELNSVRPNFSYLRKGAGRRGWGQHSSLSSAGLSRRGEGSLTLTPAVSQSQRENGRCHRPLGSKLASSLPARQTRTTPSDSLTVKAIDLVLAVIPAAAA